MLKKWGDAHSALLICVDDFSGSIPSGKIYQAEEGEDISFQGLIQLLIQMERILDEMEFPKAFTAVRSFQETIPKEPERSEENVRKGRLATLSVKVIFRQNTSWQGSVAWLDEQKEQSFRSVLEFIMLLNSALEKQ